MTYLGLVGYSYTLNPILTLSCIANLYEEAFRKCVGGDSDRLLWFSTALRPRWSSCMAVVWGLGLFRIRV